MVQSTPGGTRDGKNSLKSVNKLLIFSLYKGAEVEIICKLMHLYLFSFLGYFYVEVSLNKHDSPSTFPRDYL